MNLPVPTVISQKETPKKLKGKKGPYRQSLKKTEGEKKAQTVSLSKKLKGKKKVQTVSLSDALLHAYGTWAE